VTGPAPRTEWQRHRVVHRVGHSPDPWRWTPWQYVKATGRWDDPTGTYRVLYVADSVYACLVEVLAPFRPDPSLEDLYADLLGDPADGEFLTVPAGTVDRRWISERAVGTAKMTGRFVAIADPSILINRMQQFPGNVAVATNVLRNQRRSQRRHHAALTRLPPELEEPDFAEAATDRLDDEAAMRAVLARLSKLSRIEQEVLSLCIWEGLTPQAAAVALGVPDATVRTRLRRAREHLRLLSESASQGDTP